MQEDENNISAAIIAGAGIGDPKPLGDNLIGVVVPQGWALKEIDVEKTLDRPSRKRGTVVLDDVPSFIALVNREKTAETLVFAKQNPPGFIAVFNGNQAAAGCPSTMPNAGWGDHRATYSCPLSDEWKTWVGHDGKRMTQADFAQFMEDNLPDIAEPAGAVMLEVSRTLEAKKAVNFASAIRLSDGSQQFTYEEQIDGTAQKGQLKIPERFAIGIPVFQGSPEKWRIDARLRYRIEGGGKLAMWFDLERIHKVLDEAFAAVRGQIQEGVSLTALMGSPYTQGR